ncbi:MAG TPA: hypothetical protein VJT49_05990 [Amycolatopsis sp.]|uniref:hypothetical protein n=1 Tax=Amycolatopsis sp. TaxID=37632 RepID=UPI002B4A2739|nr:hypothetical protein [Amycolatopsis sp.]HKS44657.1 hypothetical protein [Amycolatopsis sp.]
MTNPFGSPVRRDGQPVGPRTPSGVTAVLGGLVALALAGVLGYLPITDFVDYGISDLPDHTKISDALYFGAAILLLLGALMTFLRLLAGSVLLLAGGLATIAAVVAEPLLIHPYAFVEFFDRVFRFVPNAAFVRIGGIVGGPLVVLLAAQPSTFRYLRYRPPDAGYGPPYSGPARGW